MSKGWIDGDDRVGRKNNENERCDWSPKKKTHSKTSAAQDGNSNIKVMTGVSSTLIQVAFHKSRNAVMDWPAISGPQSVARRILLHENDCFLVDINITRVLGSVKMSFSTIQSREWRVSWPYIILAPPRHGPSTPRTRLPLLQSL